MKKMNYKEKAEYTAPWAECIAFCSPLRLLSQMSADASLEDFEDVTDSY